MEQKLSFSQRNGYSEINNTIQIESMDRNLCIDIWNYLYMEFFKEMEHTDLTDPLLIAVYAHFLHWRIDNIPFVARERQATFSALIFRKNWNQVYDLLEFLYQTLKKGYRKLSTAVFERRINNILMVNYAGYRMIEGQITPITDENEIQTIQQAIDNSPYKEIGIHLMSALSFFSDKTAPDYRNSIKESISAVEVYCRKITGTSTLGEALKKLHTTGVTIPSSLKEAITKLYVFTNGKDGIRHALMDDTEVGQAEAYFMLIACSSFINYLKTKQSMIKQSS